MKLLLTSSSFHETPGPHHELLQKNFGTDVDYRKGPLAEKDILPLLPEYDAVICGDDELTEKVLSAAREKRLRVISKYGVGLDKINLEACKALGIKVTSCPGVNATSVAEHVFALLFSFYKNMYPILSATRSGKWLRLTGREIAGKRIAIIGSGAIGICTIRIAQSLGMNVACFDLPDRDPKIDGVEFFTDIKEALRNADVVSLHTSLNAATRGLFSTEIFEFISKYKPVLINTARAGLVDQAALLNALNANQISGYLTDVLITEPMSSEEPLHKFENVLITSHIGSRTYDSVARQGSLAVQNLIYSCKEVGLI